MELLTATDHSGLGRSRRCYTSRTSGSRLLCRRRCRRRRCFGWHEPNRPHTHICIEPQRLTAGPHGWVPAIEVGQRDAVRRRDGATLVTRLD